MPASKKTQAYVKDELPYELLKLVYKNSRASLRKLGKELSISYHTIKQVLDDLEDRYKITYTLELDEAKLGFSGGVIITIKFGVKPGIDAIKEMFAKDFFVQDAYLAEGDFDLLLYVVGLNQIDFNNWQWALRRKLGPYKIALKFAYVNRKTMGFFPLKSKTINESEILSPAEKLVLTALNDNSRIKLCEIAKTTKIKDLDRIIYIIKKMKNKGIIKKFTALIQNPDKKVYSGFGISVSPSEEHDKLTLNLFNLINSEDKHESVNDYALVFNTTGFWDVFFFTVFNSGEALLKKGPDALKDLWKIESPVIEKAILTDVIIGKWPFHLENYETYAKLFENKSHISIE